MKEMWRRFKVLKAYKDLFSTPNGQLVLADLMKECGVVKSSYRGNPDDLLFNEGKRIIGLYVLANTNVDLSALTKMLERQSQEDQNES